MGATNKTPYYDLPQFVATDKASWLGDVNGAMLAIDTAIKAAYDKADAAEGTAGSAQATATSAENAVAAATAAAEQASATANSALSAANTAATNAQTALTNARTAQATAESASTNAQSAIQTAESAAAAASDASASASAASASAATAQQTAAEAKTLSQNNANDIIDLKARKELVELYRGNSTSGSVSLNDSIENYSEFMVFTNKGVVGNSGGSGTKPLIISNNEIYNNSLLCRAFILSVSGSTITRGDAMQSFPVGSNIQSTTNNVTIYAVYGIR